MHLLAIQWTQNFVHANSFTSCTIQTSRLLYGQRVPVFVNNTFTSVSNLNLDLHLGLSPLYGPKRFESCARYSHFKLNPRVFLRGHYDFHLPLIKRTPADIMRLFIWRTVHRLTSKVLCFNLFQH